MVRKAYSYIRMSTAVQLKGDSLRRQLELSETYAAENGLELVKSIEGVSLQDIGVSAYKSKNSEIGVLRIFLEALRENKIESNSSLLIESLDRLSRDKVSSALSQFLEILAFGIEIVTLIDGQKYTQKSIDENIAPLYISLAIMLRANEESATKSRRIRAVWENKRSKIETNKLTKVCPGWMSYDEDKKKFLLIDDKATVVKLIFEMCSKTCGVLGIVKYLNSNNVPEFGRGKMWYRSYLIKILNNRAVLGEFQPGTRKDGIQLPIGAPIKNYYPAVVTEDVFLAAQAAIKRRTQATRGPKGPTFQNILTGLVFCKSCGVTMAYRNRGQLPKGGQTLLCTNRANGKSCTMSEWKYEDTVEIILKHLHEIDFSSLTTANDTEQKNIEGQLESIHLKIEDLIKQELRLIQMLSTEDWNDRAKAQFSQRLDEIATEIDEKTKESNNLKSLKVEQEEAQAVLRTTALKELLDNFESKKADYYWRSAVNELLRKAITRIDLQELPYVFQPWDFTNKDPEVTSYRRSSVEKSTLPFAELIAQKAFKEHCKKFTKRLFIKYKNGSTRIVGYGYGTDSSMYQNSVKSKNNMVNCDIPPKGSPPRTPHSK